MHIEWVTLEVHGQLSKLISLYVKFMDRNDPLYSDCFKLTSSPGGGAGLAPCTPSQHPSLVA